MPIFKLTGYHTPYNANFAVSGLRVFGKGNGEAPKAVKILGNKKLSETEALISWAKAEGAIGYNVRYGIAPDKLSLSWQIYEQTSLNLKNLTSGVTYNFAVDSYHENGITIGLPILLKDEQFERAALAVGE